MTVGSSLRSLAWKTRKGKGKVPGDTGEGTCTRVTFVYNCRQGERMNRREKWSRKTNEINPHRKGEKRKIISEEKKMV